MKIVLNTDPLTTATLLLALALPIAQRPPATWVEREVVAMGTTLRIGVYASSRSAGIAAIEAALEAVQLTDSVLSTWRDDSELARLNHTPPGQEAAVPPALGAWMAEVVRWSRATGGAFDPAIGALVDAWDARGQGRVPSGAEMLLPQRKLSGTGAPRTPMRTNCGPPPAWNRTNGPLPSKPWLSPARFAAA